LIPDETVSLVRERSDIVDIVGGHVELRRAGANFKGLCPFHQEKSPSFNVSQSRQMFHCFGCGEGGDVFAFLMKYEGRTFVDAVRDLAGRCGVEIVEERPSPSALEAKRKKQADRERLLSVMETVTRRFQDWLAEPVAKDARSYLVGRGLDTEAWAKYGIGYAPAGWDNLALSLRSLGISEGEAEQLGLIVARPSGGGHYDRLRDRIIFPVRDAASRVVAFGARCLPDAPDDAPKYVNSPETIVFSKSNVLYGIDLARPALRHGESAIVVEGYLDVIAMHEAGLCSAVAPMGTALTSDQAALLRRYQGRSKTVVLLFDGDEAGQAAVERALAGLSEAGLGGRVATLPPGDDPDSFVRDRGADALRELVEGAPGLVEHLIARSAERCPADGRSKAAAIRALWPAIGSISDPLERDLYRRRIATAFDVSEEVVFRYLRGGVPAERGAPVASKPVKSTPRRRAEGTVVGAIIDFPELVEAEDPDVLLSMVGDERLRWLLDQLLSRKAGGEAGDEALGRIAEEIEEEKFAKRLRGRLIAPEHEEYDDAHRAFTEGMTRLRDLTTKDETRALQKELAKAELDGDLDRATRLAQEKLERLRAS